MVSTISRTAGSEVDAIHTRLNRVSLALEDSRTYWRHADPGTPAPSLAELGFEQRWFGNKSLRRVLLLLRTFAERFDVFPSALATLHRWCPTDPVTYRNLCHWHVQLSDPLYRRFTGEFLAARWARRDPAIDRDTTVRWIEDQVGDRWSPSTTRRLANGLLAAATEAGLCSEGAGHRPLIMPKVSDEALTYLLYLLRDVSFQGTLLENPYLSSLGLGGSLLEQRLRRLEALDYRRHGELHDFGWHDDNLAAWSRAVTS